MTADPSTTPDPAPAPTHPNRAQVQRVVEAATRNGDTDLVVPAVRKRIVDGVVALWAGGEQR